MVHLSTLLTSTLALVSFTSTQLQVAAHGDHESPAAIAARDLHVFKARRSLEGCGAKLRERRHVERRLARRNELLEGFLEKRQARAAAAAAAAAGGPPAPPRNNNTQDRGHDGARPSGQFQASEVSSSSSAASSPLSSSIPGITDPASLFANQEVSCILTPEVTIGPYHVDGELIRSDVREDQAGIDLILDTQVIDVNTCEPIENVYLDLWHCNATGVYSGVIANGNGNTDDATNADSTFLRGLQRTDQDGIAQFTTIFPGWYSGRSVHIHVAAQLNGTVAENNTYIGGSFSHIGQVFLDQDLISRVAEVYPYTEDSTTLLENEEDGIFNQENTGYNATAQYQLIGESVADGVLAWISIGIDPTADNSNSVGMPDGSAPPNGTVPSGSMLPSGAVPSGAMTTA